MATIDIFNPVNVDLTISVPQVTDVSTHNVAMVTSRTLPGSVVYKLYTNVTDFIVDFPADTAPEENSWGTQFYANNEAGNLFAINTPVPDSDVSVVVSTAILNALALIAADATISPINSFYLVSAANGDELFYSDVQVVAELTNLEASGKPLLFIAQSYSTTMFNDLAGFAPAVYLKNTSLKSLAVGMCGYPSLVSEPVVPKVSAGVCGFLSQIDIDNGTQGALTGQTFFDVTPLQVGSTDVYSTVFTTTKINTLVNAQVNMYVRYQNQTQFNIGLCMAPEEIPIDYYIYRQLIEETLRNTIKPYFFPNQLPYTNATITLIHGLIQNELNKFVDAGIMLPGFTIVDPVLDFSAPNPRTLKFQITGQLGARVYTINIGGNLQG